MQAMALMACVGIAFPGLASGQAGAAKPAFEVASVKRSLRQEAGGNVRGGPGTADPGRISYLNVPLRMLLIRAYGLETNQQLEGPDWIDSVRYDIVANVPPGTTQEQCNQMLLNLLLERFQMSVRRATKEVDGYRLTVANHGAKLKESAPGAAPLPIPDGFPEVGPTGIGVGGPDGTYLLSARHRSTSFLLQLFEAQLHARIDDSTGLSGVYDYNLGFVPARFLHSSEDPNPDQPFPDLLTAVEDQLGLKLARVKLPAEIVVVEEANPEPLKD